MCVLLVSPGHLRGVPLAGQSESQIFRCEFHRRKVSGAGPPGGQLIPGADLRVLFVYIYIFSIDCDAFLLE